MLPNILGTLNNIFSLGRGTNQVNLRTASGVIQAKNYGGSWENVLGQSGGGTSTFSDMKEPTGFVNRLSSSISFNSSTRTFTVTPNTPTYSSYDIYHKNTKTTKSISENVIINNTSGIWFIYFNSDLNLIASQTPWDFSEVVPVGVVYWNSTVSTGYLSDERHGITMDWATHSYLHRTVGTRYESGFTLSGYALNTISDSAVTFGITGGYIHDEDLRHAIVHSDIPNNPFEQILNDSAQLPVFYRTGATGVWQKDIASNYAFKNAIVGSNLVSFNELTGGIWQQTECVNTNYSAVWIFATNQLSEPLVSIQGQRQDSSLSNARNNNTYESLNFGDFPFQECKVLYRVILQTSTTYGNTRKVRIVDVQDLRSISNVPSGTYTPTSHSSLAGLTSQDHPASSIYTDVGNFNILLNNTDTDMQRALDKLDDHHHTQISNIVNTDYSCNNTDRVILVTTSGINRTVTLPPASNVTGREICVKKIDNGSGNVVIEGDLSDTIDGSLNVVLTNQYSFYNMISDGDNWYLLSGLWN